VKQRYTDSDLLVLEAKQWDQTGEQYSTNLAAEWRKNVFLNPALIKISQKIFNIVHVRAQFYAVLSKTGAGRNKCKV